MEFNKKFKRGPDGILSLSEKDEEYLCEFMNALETSEFYEMYDDFAYLLQNNNKFVSSLRKQDLHIIVVCLIRIADSACGAVKDGNISDRKRLTDIISRICLFVSMLKAIQHIEEDRNIWT
jgi:hypothetical protein